MRSRSARPTAVARAVAAAAVLALVMLAPAPLPAPAAGAADLTGCTGTATSRDADRAVLDRAVADGTTIVDANGDPVFTKDNPFVVDNEGTVVYRGASGTVITGHTWKIKLLGVTVVSGGSANASQTKAAVGVFDVSKKLPVGLVGLVKVDGDLAGTGGSCSGSGYVKLDGNPWASPVTWGGVVFALLGLGGLYLARPRAVAG